MDYEANWIVASEYRKTAEKLLPSQMIYETTKEKREMRNLADQVSFTPYSHTVILGDPLL